MSKHYSPTVQTPFGTFCAVCQSLLSIEEEDWRVCDACDGEGIGGDDDFEPVTPQDHTPPELRAVLAEALAKPLQHPPAEILPGDTGNARAAPAMTGNLPVAGAPTNSNSTKP